MPENAQTLTYLFAVVTLLLDVSIVMVLVSRVATGAWLPKCFMSKVRQCGMKVAMLLALGAVGMSLWYSEIVELPVCSLCWFARTMMYPLAILLIVAVIRRDTAVWPYVLSLSGIGMGITGYHHLYQIGVVQGTLCAAIANGGDCAKRYVFEFDFVTMPLMGFTLFAAVALLVWLAQKKP